jgi:type IV pilus assembly protein PilY1
MTTRTRHLTTIASALYGALLVFLAQPVRATVPVSDVPLFLQVAVPPNIVLTLDDSVSMARAYVPEHCGQFDLNCSALNNRWAKSTYGNPLYYNPRVKYPAPRTGVGQNVLPATSGTGFQWTSVYRNGFDTGYGTINMTTGYRPTASLAFGTQNGGTSVSETYMNHFSQDAVRCSSNRCQRYTPPASGAGTGGTWSNISGTSCSNHSQCSGQSTHAYYYVYNENNANCNKTPTDNDCYTIRFVTASSGPGDFDLNDDGKIDALDKDERQNFANWYAFSRTRTLATQTAATIAFADLDPSIRVAWQGLSTCTGNSTFVTSQCQGYKKNFSFSNAIKPFDGTHKSNFYKWLFQQPTVGYTLLPKAMQRVGEYYKQSGANSPYDDNLTSSSVNTETSCRRNYHVMMTDGIWTESVAIGNSDNTTGPLGDPSAPSYQRQRPYVDSTNNTLADVAFHYWRNDLRSGLENNLTPQIEEFDPTEAERYWNPKNNPATWQHMVNFTIGLGLTGFLKAAGLEWDGDMYGGSYPKLKAGTINWPAAFGSLDNSANVADLWHAAINSRGKFFSADDPKSLSDAFTQALETIAAKSGSSAALSANSTSIQPGNTVIYQAKFNSDWSGTLVAIEVLDNGKVGQQLWSAAELIPPHNQRRIFTYNGTTGLEFTTAVCSATGGLNAAQRSVLNRDISGTIDNRCADRVEWLRGNPASEVRNGGTMRNRPVVNGKTNVMGDIINSDPAFVYRQDYGYSQLPVGGSEYPAFLAANASRRPMIYVGANDGKLYGIDAGLDADDPEKGKERFAYIPGGVYEHLNELTDPNYTHRYYVDGSISVGDAYLGGSWKSVLVAGLNAGGRTIYALDVTDPENFKASNVLWEFTDEDLGHLQPAADRDPGERPVGCCVRQRLQQHQRRRVSLRRQSRQRTSAEQDQAEGCGRRRKQRCLDAAAGRSRRQRPDRHGVCRGSAWQPVESQAFRCQCVGFRFRLPRAAVLSDLQRQSPADHCAAEICDEGWQARRLLRNGPVSLQCRRHRQIRPDLLRRSRRRRGVKRTRRPAAAGVPAGGHDLRSQRSQDQQARGELGEPEGLVHRHAAALGRRRRALGVHSAAAGWPRDLCDRDPERRLLQARRNQLAHGAGHVHRRRAGLRAGSQRRWPVRWR